MRANQSLTKLLLILSTMAIVGGSALSTAAAQARKQSRECTIEDVAIYDNRVVIQCDFKGGKKSPANYYAVAVDTPTASMVLQLGLNSLRRKVKVFYIDDVALNPPGCEPTNCRRLEGIIAIER